MKWLRNYNNYKEAMYIDLELDQIDLKESLNIWHDDLLTSISAEEVNILDVIKLPSDFKNKDIDSISNSVEFINSLSSIGLKKSHIQNSDDFESFINKPCKFMFVFDTNSNELENPEFIIFQSWNETLNKWDDIKLFKVKDDIKKFYDKLTSRTIEIVDGDENYIYSTSNGNDWDLQNIEKFNDNFPKSLRKEELQKLLDNKQVKLNII